MPMKKAVSYRLSEEGKRLLKELSEQNGINQTAMLEVLIRQASKKLK